MREYIYVPCVNVIIINIIYMHACYARILKVNIFL